MFTRPFRFERAGDLAEACELLRLHGEGAKVIAGGQSLMALMNLGLVQPEVVIDIFRAAGSREVSATDGYLTVGALMTHATLTADPLAARAQPLLGAAACKIGNPRVRGRGTLGGSLAHSDPAAELPLVMVALGASYVITDGRSSRTAKAEEFHLGFLSTQLAEDELVVSARVPALGPGWGWSFQEVSRRDGDFALAAVAALVRIAGGVIVESRIAVGGVGDRPLRLADVEISLSGARRDEITDRFGPIQGIRPISDCGASAAYRAHLCRVLMLRALAEASPAISGGRVTAAITITLTVNGREVCKTAGAHLSLLRWLRDVAGVTDPKYGCGEGICGSCTVLLDGQPVSSCLVIAAQADGSAVTTAAGLLEADGSLGGLQRAFHATHAAQCGFCTPGMLMTAAAALADGRQRSRHEIRAVLHGNLCRCTGYGPIVDAIELAQEEAAQDEAGR